MRIERTFDRNLIRSIITHPQIYPHVKDDGSPSPESYEPLDSYAVYFLTPIDEEPLGVFIVVPLNSVCYEIHTCLLPSAWGRKAKQAANLVLKWIVENTACEKVVTNVPSDNIRAFSFAIRAGLIEEGINRKSFMKNGKLLDQHFLGITKEEICLLPPQ